MSRAITERVSQAQRYRVKGTNPFPIDMLRYDACWPASESDSYLIASTHNMSREGAVEVEVRARQPLTVGRWESFGWRVIPVPA